MKNIDDLSDELFDDLFKDKLERHEEPLWENAWPKMEILLDERKRRLVPLFFLRIAASVLLFLSLGITSYFLFNKTADQQSEIKKSEIIYKNLSDDKKESLTIKKKKYSKKESEILNNENDLALNYKSEGFLRNKGQETIKNVISDNISLLDVQKYEALAKTELILLEKTTEKILVPPNKKGEGLKLIENELKLSQRINNEISNKDSTVLVFAESVHKDVSNESSNFEALLDIQKDIQFSKLSLVFGGSPDVSGAPNSAIGKLGSNFQILVGYEILPKLLLKIGLIKSMKYYDANAKDYAWPSKWGIPSTPLIEVSASCNMLDIPISLSYFVFSKNQVDVYASAGLTSYKMLNEKYEYHYQNENDPNIKWRKWEGETGFFGAGVANFGIGVERRLGRGLWVQIEPFVKVPLKQVGFGSVKLRSFGMFVNLKTDFIFRQKSFYKPN